VVEPEVRRGYFGPYETGEFPREKSYVGYGTRKGLTVLPNYRMLGKKSREHLKTMVGFSDVPCKACALPHVKILP
jgi:hypothetical protein